MAVISCGSGHFNVQVEGPADAPALMLLNSLSCNLSMWEAQAAALSDRFRVIRYDGRGQGGSIISPAPYTMDQLGQDALSILDALGIDRTNFCGLSMGGMVGMWLLTHAPHRITRAVLANTAAHMGPASLWDDRIRLARQGGMQATVEPTVARWFPPAFHASAPQVIDRMRAGIRDTPLDGYVACCAAIRDMDQRQAIRSVITPTLVLVGAHDPATTPADGRLIHDAIAGSAMVTLPTGHISAVEQPEAFTREIATFLS
jgi:3-oxoadipate enol-lactonase